MPQDSLCPNFVAKDRCNSKLNKLMKQYTPEKPYEKLTQKELEVYRELSSTPYGETLARQVAEKLIRDSSERSKNGSYSTGGGLYHSHRDYCGIGLYYYDRQFVIGEVNDAMGPDPVLVAFDDREEFISWLAGQSDQSMSLVVSDRYGSTRFNNQTITKIRLEWYLEEHYSPTWNAYCVYLREK